MRHDCPPASLPDGDNLHQRSPRLGGHRWPPMGRGSGVGVTRGKLCWVKMIQPGSGDSRQACPAEEPAGLDHGSFHPEARDRYKPDIRQLKFCFALQVTPRVTPIPLASRVK